MGCNITEAWFQNVCSLTQVVLFANNKGKVVMLLYIYIKKIKWYILLLLLSLLLLAFVFLQFYPVQSNPCLMNGDFMPEVWRAQLTTELTETPAVCLFAFGLKPARHLQTHTHAPLISLGAWYLYGHGTCIGIEAKLQEAPQGGELSPVISIATVDDWPAQKQ